MKLIKQPKCRVCKNLIGRNGVHCHSVLMNGCDAYFCYLCWPGHSSTHDDEWRHLTDEAKDAIIQERADNG